MIRAASLRQIRRASERIYEWACCKKRCPSESAEIGMQTAPGFLSAPERDAFRLLYYPDCYLRLDGGGAHIVRPSLSRRPRTDRATTR